MKEIYLARRHYRPPPDFSDIGEENMSAATEPQRRTLHGRVKGKMIEIVEEHALHEGQEVLVIVNRLAVGKVSERMLRAAGSLANMPDWDEAMIAVQQERKMERGQR